MPCDLAVTIQKAVIKEEQIQALMTPEVLEKAVVAYLKGHESYKMFQPVCYAYGNTVDIFLLNGNSPDYRVSVTAAGVNVRLPRGMEAEAELLSSQLVKLLAAVGNKLLASHVRRTLKGQFGDVNQESATVDNQGQSQQVVKLSFEV